MGTEFRRSCRVDGDIRRQRYFAPENRPDVTLTGTNEPASLMPQLTFAGAAAAPCGSANTEPDSSMPPLTFAGAAARAPGRTRRG